MTACILRERAVLCLTGRVVLHIIMEWCHRGHLSHDELTATAVLGHVLRKRFELRWRRSSETQKVAVRFAIASCGASRFPDAMFPCMESHSRLTSRIPHRSPHRRFEHPINGINDIVVPSHSSLCLCLSTFPSRLFRRCNDRRSDHPNNISHTRTSMCLDGLEIACSDCRVETISTALPTIVGIAKMSAKLWIEVGEKVETRFARMRRLRCFES